LVKVHLYGELRRYGGQPRADRETVVEAPISGEATLAQVLEQIGIPQDEVAQVFLNAKLLTTCNSMAPWLGYQTAEDRIPRCGERMKTPIRNGDRLGLFPHRMAMLVV